MRFAATNPLKQRSHYQQITKWGMICPAETPEGAPVGVVKNLALSCSITGYSEVEPIIDYISGLDVSNNAIFKKISRNASAAIGFISHAINIPLSK